MLIYKVDMFCKVMILGDVGIRKHITVVWIRRDVCILVHGNDNA